MQAHETQNHPGIRKMPTAIPGVDEITDGGIPRGRTTLVLGGPGCGKTIFALHALVNGATQWGEPGIFVAFEENSRQIIENAASFGWDLPALEQQKLFFLDARIPSDTIMAGTYDLTGLLAGLQAKAEEIGAKRIVFDSIDVLLTLLGDARAERLELYRIHDWLAQSGLTGIISSRIHTAEAGYAERFGFLQFMADCVLLLDHQMTEHVSQRNFRVMKYRGSGFSENAYPLVITPTGIEIASIGLHDADLDFPVSTERLSTGVERMDTMLHGGYYRGTSMLITGAPGTAKTTLGGAFLQAACQRGERAMLISFDESAGEVERNLASVSIDLAPHRDAGLLQIRSFRSDARSAEEHLIRIKQVVTDHQPRCLVIDPLSAILKSGGQLAGEAVAHRLLTLMKQQGVTVLCTSLLSSSEPMSEATPLAISTIADTWIHLSYAVLAGERNRALTIVKSRGTSHSNQVRELLLSDQGLTLADVYTSGGTVLMGALRAEKEAEDLLARERLRLQSEQRCRELEAARLHAQGTIDELQREVVLHDEEMTRVRRAQALVEAEWQVRLGDIRLARSADLDNVIDAETPDHREDADGDR